MIDFHTHILPEMDDGAKNVDESLAMLSLLHDIGVTDVVLTPHFYPSVEPISLFIERRKKSYNTLISAIKSIDAKMPTLHLGAEVYLDMLLSTNFDAAALSIDGRKEFLLLEINFSNSSSLKSIITKVEKLTFSTAIVPILAHIDRYSQLYFSKNLKKFMDIGCYFQINPQAFSKGIKAFLLRKHSKRGLISAIGSDSHSIEDVKTFAESIKKMGDDEKNFYREASLDLLRKKSKTFIY